MVGRGGAWLVVVVVVVVVVRARTKSIPTSIQVV